MILKVVLDDGSRLVTLPAAGRPESLNVVWLGQVRSVSEFRYTGHEIWPSGG